MKKINYLILPFFTVLLTLGQDKVNVNVEYTETAPEIDGVEEEIWNSVDSNAIDKNFQSEAPTVTAYWKALWDDDFLYVLISVKDDDHWPNWVSGGDWWDYDQTEVYLDVNEELNDGMGPGNTKGSGHYQALGYFVDGGSGNEQDLAESNYRPDGSYCYVLTGEDYVIEYALDYESFVNKDGITLSVDDFKSLVIGFDVTIIDQDEGVTTSRQRAVWQNIGDTDESYNNMDDCGTITLVQSAENISHRKRENLSIYPNPVENNISVSVEFDKLVISNMLGKEIITIEASSNSTDISSLSEGIYIIQVFKSGVLLDMNKFVKK